MSRQLSAVMMTVLCLFTVLFTAQTASAEVVVKEISYEHAGQTLKGVLTYDSALTDPRPGILVVHEWWGINDYVKSRAQELAAQGYVAFALDMFGDGKQTEHPSEAGKWSGEIRANQDNWLARAQAGLEVLKSQPEVDSSKLAVVGYCFGGSTALLLAYHEPSLSGVVSYHGGLILPPEGKEIKPKILVCHGAADAMIPPAQVEAFGFALEQVHADYVIAIYSNAKHGFTNPNADKIGLEALGYNALADSRSQTLTKSFFEELFGQTPHLRVR